MSDELSKHERAELEAEAAIVEFEHSWQARARIIEGRLDTVERRLDRIESVKGSGVGRVPVGTDRNLH